MQLYKINEKTAELKSKVEAGEIDGQAVIDTLESLDDIRYEKITNLTNWRQQDVIDAKVYRDKAREWNKKAKSLENTAKWIDGYLMDDLIAHGQKSYRLENNDLKLRNVKPKVIIDDENRIPDDYVRVKTTKSIDKAGAYQALKENDVDGMHLEPSQSLNVK